MFLSTILLLKLICFFPAIKRSVYKLFELFKSIVIDRNGKTGPKTIAINRNVIEFFFILCVLQPFF